MWWRLVLVGSIGKGAAFAPSPIRWDGRLAGKYVVSLAPLPISDEALPQSLTIKNDFNGMTSPDAVPYFTVKADNTIVWDAKGWCIEASSPQSGAAVNINRCNGGPAQKWNWLPWGSIQLRGSNQCLHVSVKEGGFNGIPLSLRHCENKATEAWELGTTAQNLLPSFIRHVLMSFTLLAALLTLGVHLQRMLRRSRAVLLQGPAVVDQGGVCMISPVAKFFRTAEAIMSDAVEAGAAEKLEDKAEGEFASDIGNSAAAKAMQMLGAMGMQAVSDATPGKKINFKEFVAKAKITHNRVIKAVDGGTVPDYLRLPVDEYAIYDPRLMRRLPEADGGDGEIFELTLPSLRPQPGTYMPQPKVSVRVTPEPDRISLQSIDANLFGGAEGELPPNMTAADLEIMKGLFDFQLSTTISWSEARRRAPGATKLRCRTDVQVKIFLPPPFTRVPRPLVQGAIGLVMKFVGSAILPQFAKLLEADYQRWCNGTRDLTRGLGSLCDEDGYLVVSEDELKEFKCDEDGYLVVSEDELKEFKARQEKLRAEVGLDLEGASAKVVSEDELKELNAREENLRAEVGLDLEGASAKNN